MQYLEKSVLGPRGVHSLHLSSKSEVTVSKKSKQTAKTSIISRQDCVHCSQPGSKSRSTIAAHKLLKFELNQRQYEMLERGWSH